MKLVTASEMRLIDAETNQCFGIPSLLLMENAGRAVAEKTRRLLHKGGSVAILAGVGNNGGDGFVTARHLSGSYSVTVYIVGDLAKLRGDAALNFGAMQAFPIRIHALLPAQAVGLPTLLSVERPDLLLDALFGTGLSGRLSPEYVQLLDGLNQLGLPVLAVDIPSGLSADTGIPLGAALRAGWTVTIGLLKVGLMLPPAADWVGELEVARCCFPPALLRDERWAGNRIGPDLLSGILPQRMPDAHKGTSGKVLIIAGSLPYRGAANLAGEAACRAGAGLVELALPRSFCLANLEKPDELIQLPLSETSEHALSLDALDTLLAEAESCRAVVIGPGLSQDPGTVNLVLRFIRNNRVPTVVDADALNACAGEPEVLQEAAAPLLLTPHPGELARLLQMSTAQIQTDRIACTIETCRRFDCITALKGFRTVVADPQGHFYINPTGNPGMATGGMGDVLAGLAAGILAQGTTLLEAALLSVYAHGLAGDKAAAELGERGIMPSDLLSRIPRALEEAQRAGVNAPD